MIRDNTFILHFLCQYFFVRSSRCQRGFKGFDEPPHQPEPENVE